ncbi:MAG: DUF58 domain-containing protein [Phycisphaerales bacterium]
MLAPSSSPRPKTLDDLLGPGLAARLDRLDILSRRVFSGKLPGERRSRRRGSSVEFDDYRDYLPGDDLRRLDWNVLARLDRVFVKLFREDEDQSLHLVIDASGSMDAGTPSKLVASLRLALAIGYVGLVNQTRVLASVIGAPGRPALQRLAAVRGRPSLKRLAGFLMSAPWPADDATWRPGSSASSMNGISGGNISGQGSGGNTQHPPGTFTRALRELGATGRGAGVMVLCSDFLVPEDPLAGLTYLASAGGSGGGAAGGAFDVHCFQVLSPGEMAPESEPGVLGDLRMTDAETGRTTEVTVTRTLVGRYRARLTAHVEAIRRGCLARGMSHAVVRSDADTVAVLTEQMRRGRLVG